MEKVDCTENYRICSHCGERMEEGYFLNGEYACSDKCAIALYDGKEKELRAELKRRLSEERSARAKGRTYKAQYAYATATITRVTDEPYCRKNYFGIVNNDSDCGPMNERWLRESLLFIEQAKFTKNSAPKPGDVVRVKSRRTKYNPNGFGNTFSTPYITEIITPSQN